MSRRAKRRLALAPRVVIALALGVYAVLAVGSGLDRASYRRPEIARFVPDVLADVALSTLARDALIHQHPELALQEARKAVATSPVEAINTAVLGLSSLQAGMEGPADAAYRLSDRMGWREPTTQSYMIHQAVNRGDYDQAARRLDAMLRQQPDFHRNRQMMDPVESNLYAQAAWVKRLAMRPPWLDTYITDVQGLPPEQLGVRAALLADLADRGVRLGCDGVDAVVHELVAGESYDDAQTLWQMHCPQQGGNLLWDGHLAHLTEQADKASDFRWQLLSSGDLAATLRGEGRGDGQWVEVVNNGAFPMPFLRQMVVPAPGRYRLNWIARDENGRISDLVFPKVSCGDLEATPAAGGHAQAMLTVSAACSRVVVEFQAKPHDRPVIFGDITLNAEGNRPDTVAN